MKNILTFIIPVKHPANATDWSELKRQMTETVRSIANQDSDGWKAIIVANHEADLPALPNGFDVKRVDFPPNQHYKLSVPQERLPDSRWRDLGRKEIQDLPEFPQLERFWTSHQIDKGRRILAGMLHAGDMGHVMLVDCDDLISRRLTSFVKSNPRANGWYVRDGYVWNDGGWLLYRYPNFSQLCGTCHIIRADLFNLPPNLEAADNDYMDRLGSHRPTAAYLRASGNPLEPLPFEGAVYRTGHRESFSLTTDIFKQYFALPLVENMTGRSQSNDAINVNPEGVPRTRLPNKLMEFGRRISRLRIRDRQIQTEFFGG